MKNVIIIVISLTAILSCADNRKYANESEKILKQLYLELGDSSCIFMIHSYGAYLPPILTSKQLETELSSYFGENAWLLIKKQRDLSKTFENDIFITKNQLSIIEFNTFKEKVRINGSLYWNQFVENYDCIKGISIPIFNNDFEYAYVYEYQIAGANNASGSCRIYQLKNHKWILVKTFNNWIS